MSALAGTEVPRLPRGVRLRADAVRGGHVLLAPERSFELDAVAAAVLALVDGVRTVGEIAATLALRFNADPATIEADVADMLGDLVAKRVVEL